jgi:hypothetical protein
VFTPYDWQEGIGNRAQYIEGKLAQGVPVLAVSLEEGILLFTFRRQARKIYEIYDRLLLRALGSSRTSKPFEPRPSTSPIRKATTAASRT